MVHERLLSIDPFLGEHIAVFQSAHRGIHALAVSVENLGELSDIVERLVAFEEGLQSENVSICLL